VEHGPRKIRFDFDGNLDHVMLGLGHGVKPCDTSIGGYDSVPLNCMFHGSPGVCLTVSKNFTGSAALAEVCTLLSAVLVNCVCGCTEYFC